MTTHAVVYTWLFIHIGVILVVTSYYTLGAALAPTLTSRARRQFAARPWLPIVIGLAISVPWMLAAIVLLQQAPAVAKFGGAALGCLWILSGLIGGAGIAQHVGGGDITAGRVSWVQTFRGGLFISLTWVLPLVGWLGMFPLTMSAGVGCLVLGIFFGRNDKTAVETPMVGSAASA